MSCKSAIYTAQTGSQSVLAGGTISPGAIVRRFGCGVGLNGDGITLSAPGYYDIDVSITAAPVAAGAVTATLYRNGVAIAGATATATAAAAGDFVNLSLTALERVPCNGNTATLTLVLTGGDAAVTNIATVIQKI